MQRFVFAALVGLSLAIGLTMGTVAWRTTTFDRTVPALGSADPAIGFAFYEGIDQILAGGDASALEQVVTSDFVDHDSADAMDRSAGELVDQLTAFGASFPGTRLHVTDIQSSASSLVAAVAPMELGSAQVAGMTLAVQPMRGGYEVLSIRNGKVSERWSVGLPELTATTFDDSEYSPGMTANVTTRLYRVALPQGTERTWWGDGSSVVIVERGSVRLAVDYQNEDGVMLQHTDTLQEGAATRTAPATKTRLTSDGDETAQVLIYSTDPVAPIDYPPRLIPGGTISTLLWTSNLVVAPQSEWRLSVGKVAVPAGGDLTFSVVPDTKVLLCSNESAVQVNAPGGSVESLDASFVATDEGSSGTVDAGMAAYVSDATQLSFRAEDAAAATVWLITLVPVDAATPVSASWGPPSSEMS
jgi:hypothetical protein